MAEHQDSLHEELIYKSRSNLNLSTSESNRKIGKGKKDYREEADGERATQQISRGGESVKGEGNPHQIVAAAAAGAGRTPGWWRGCSGETGLWRRGRNGVEAVRIYVG